MFDATGHTPCFLLDGPWGGDVCGTFLVLASHRSMLRQLGCFLLDGVPGGVSRMLTFLVLGSHIGSMLQSSRTQSSCNWMVWGGA